MVGFDTLILGCTHYPLLQNVIQKVLGKTVALVDSPQEVAREVARTLRLHNMENPSGLPVHHFYVSDYTKSFEESTRLFFKGKIKLELMNIWKEF